MGDIEKAAAAKAADVAERLREDLRRQMQDGGISTRRLAAAAGIHHGTLSRILAGETEPNLATLARLGAALNADLSLRLYPNAGPNLRDRWQTRMADEVLRVRHPRWEPYPEAYVTTPVKGWIDLALHERRERVLIANELQSEIRRFEQLVRWQAAKAQALPSWEGYVHLGDAPRISQLVIVRRTRANRQAAAGLERQIRAAFPAHPDDAIAALSGTSTWPGAALAWMLVDEKGARLVPGR
jgi:transcriptional regulator with XRE-family HTH domain